jgi:hypothetical protein
VNRQFVGRCALGILAVNASGCWSLERCKAAMDELAIGCATDDECRLGYGDDVATGGEFVDYAVTVWNVDEAEELYVGIHRCGQRWYPDEYFHEMGWMLPMCVEGVCEAVRCTDDNYDGYCPGVSY